jgi:hypothetical protein
MIFEEERQGAGGRYTFWLGKVQRLIRLNGRKRTEYREPIDLGSYSGTILVVAHWYRPVAGATSGLDVDTVYELKEADHKYYDVKHVLAPVQLGVRRIVSDGTVSFQYNLAHRDREALDAAIADVAQAAGSETAEARRSSQARRKRVREAQGMPDDGRRVSQASSSRGRVITAVQYEA